MTRTLALIAALSLPATAGDPIRVYVDGVLIGHAAEDIEYRLASGELHITTHEGVVGCEQSVVFWDRFES